MPEPLLDADDIQGNVIPGFRRRRQLLVGYRAASEGTLRKALAVLSPLITPAAPVVRHRDARKDALAADDLEPEIADLWVNIALGAAAMKRLGEDAVAELDAAFRVGMRAARTGDPWSPVLDDGSVNPWNPSNWKIGKPGDPLDLLLIMGYDDWSLSKGDELLARLVDTGIEEIHRDSGHRLARDAEHFGFADGISEVGVRGDFRIDGVVRPITTRYGVQDRDGVSFGKPGQPLVWPGQFLVGAPRGSGEPDLAPARYLNGSFLVFRRLTQDVRAFDEDTASMAASLAIPPQQLRARIVGRWPSGDALMRHDSVPAQTDVPFSINYFLFGSEAPGLVVGATAVPGAPADPAPVRGLRCPAFAHIRKVNPRDLPTDLGDAARTLGFQMLRRGIPFGPVYDRVNPANPDNRTERGLLFLSYQRSPSLQFERLNSSWMNVDDGPGPGGFDLLVGQRVSSQTGTHVAKEAIWYDAPEPAAGHPFSAPRTWVRPSGGAYLFAPPMHMVASMAAGPAAAGMAVRRSARRSQAAAPVRHDGETVVRTLAGRNELLEGRWPETALLHESSTALGGAGFSMLDLSGAHFPTETLTAEEAASLAGEPYLTTLQVDGTTLDGTALAGLVRGLPRLRSLNLAGCDIDDADVATLIEARPDLVELELGFARPRDGHRFEAPRLTAGLLRALRAAPCLRTLSLRGIPIGDAQVVSHAKWDSLETLDLSGSPLSDAGAVHLAKHRRLLQLKLDDTEVGDTGADELLARPWRELSISRTRVSQASILRAAHPETLRALGLARLQLDDGIAPLLRRCELLESIDLGSTNVSTEVARVLGSLGSLRSVTASHTRLRAGDIARLLSAPVAQLWVSGVPADAVDRQTLASCRSLRQVTLSIDDDWRGLDEVQAEVTLAARPPEAGGPPGGLRRLALDGLLSQDLAGRLAQLEGLQVLSAVSVDAGLRMRGYLQLREFRAESSGLGDSTLAELAALPSMTALYVSGNRAISTLGNAMSRAIHTLELRDTKFDDSAMEHIAKALPRLHCIDVPGTRVTAEGIAMLARGAGNLQSLAIDAGQLAATSIDALDRCRRLVELYLYGAETTSATLASISHLGLRELNLVGARVSDDVVPHLAAMPRLRVLRTGGALSPFALRALRALQPELSVWPD